MNLFRRSGGASLVCPKCKKAFAPPPGRNAAVEKALSKEGAPAWLECPHCYHDFAVVHAGSEEEEDTPLRCPVVGCDGWVSYVTMKARAPFFGCGECGSFWRKEASLFRDITAVVKRFPYRRKSYEKSGETWLPGDPDKETKDYEEKIAKEPAEHGTDFDKT